MRSAATEISSRDEREELWYGPDDTSLQIPVLLPRRAISSTPTVTFSKADVLENSTMSTHTVPNVQSMSISHWTKP